VNEVRYPVEVLDEEHEDDGTMPANVDELRRAVVGHRIVKAEEREFEGKDWPYRSRGSGLVLTLDDGREVRLASTDDCCAYTELDYFLAHPNLVNHVILGVGTTDQYTRWHIYADFGDVLQLTVGWSCGNPFYYAYGFAIDVVDNGDVAAS
jgi:hypothetical protein